MPPDIPGSLFPPLALVRKSVTIYPTFAPAFPQWNHRVKNNVVRLKKGITNLAETDWLPEEVSVLGKTFRQEVRENQVVAKRSDLNERTVKQHQLYKCPVEIRTGCPDSQCQAISFALLLLSYIKQMRN